MDTSITTSVPDHPKLEQTQLPFEVLPLATSDMKENSKKRKLSSENELCTKIVRHDSESSSLKDLTPRQRLKRQEIQQRRKEREQMKQEKELERAKAREERERKRIEEIEKRKQEKEEREKKRQAEITARNEEKRLKEEERKAKEEERKVKEEEKRLKKEEERKAKEEERKAKEEEKRLKEEQEKKQKEKIAAHFTKFFVPKPKQQHNESVEQSDFTSSLFMPFQVKEDMKLAVIKRRNLEEQDIKALDEFLLGEREVDESGLYLTQLKSAQYTPGCSENTWTVTSEEPDVAIADGEKADSWLQEPDELLDKYRRSKKLRWKLLQFHENRRPAYWGTWRKRSKIIKGWAPFREDKDILDYQVDSDDEWEEEEPGESLHGSDEEKEKESEDEYEVDNDVFVPHGYLSEEEAQSEIELSPDTQKAKLNLLEQEFNAELKEKTARLKPRIYGCFWISNDVEKGHDPVSDLLLSFRAVWDTSASPIVVPTCSSPSNDKQITSSGQSSKQRSFKIEFPESALPELIKFVHGHKRKCAHLAKEFSQFLLDNCYTAVALHQSVITRKIKEISEWKVVEEDGLPSFMCWYVSDEVRSQYNLSELRCADNKYNIEEKTNSASKVQMAVAGSSEKVKRIVPTIIKFAKVLTPEEKEKQLKITVANNNSSCKKSEPVSQSNENRPDSYPTTPTSARSEKPKKYATLYSFVKKTADGSEVPKHSSKVGTWVRSNHVRGDICEDVADDFKECGVQEIPNNSPLKPCNPENKCAESDSLKKPTSCQPEINGEPPLNFKDALKLNDWRLYSTKRKENDKEQSGEQPPQNVHSKFTSSKSSEVHSSQSIGRPIKRITPTLISSPPVKRIAPTLVSSPPVKRIAPTLKSSPPVIRITPTVISSPPVKRIAPTLKSSPPVIRISPTVISSPPVKRIAPTLISSPKMKRKDGGE